MSQRPISLAFITGTWLLLASPACIAGAREDGAAAFSQRDYATAIRLWRPLAEQGDAEAENNLAQMYDAGFGVPADHAEALRWRTQAAEHGNLTALKHLIDRSMNFRNDTEWRHWVEIAAAKGDAESLFVLGKSFLYGQFGNPKDSTRAIELLQDGANRGNAKAAVLLGTAYSQGIVIPRDPEQAVIWLQKAADQGDMGALTALGMMYGYGQGVPKDKAKAVALFQKIAAKGGDYHTIADRLIAQLEQADAPAPPDFDAVRARAEQGDAAAQTQLGRIYSQQNSALKDDAKAFAWYQAAALQGNPDAEAYLSVMYRNGQGVAKDLNQAIKWLRKAADDGQADSQHLVSRFYARGENGFPVDLEQSLNWLEKSSASGDKTAQVELARRLWDGLGVPQDREEATKLFQKAALLGDFEAQMTLGQHLEAAIGDKPGLQEALRWYRMAAAQDNPLHQAAQAYADALEARIAREATASRKTWK
jgi:TPR repeat protein